MEKIKNPEIDFLKYTKLICDVLYASPIFICETTKEEMMQSILSYLVNKYDETFLEIMKGESKHKKSEVHKYCKYETAKAAYAMSQVDKDQSSLDSFL